MIGMLVVVGVWTAGFAALNYRGVRKWRDSWELARWVPTLILVLWDFYFIIGAASDPTSHNLWLIEMLGITMLSLIVFAIMAITYDARTRLKRRSH